MSFSEKIKAYKSEFISQSEVVSKTDEYFISSYIKLSNKDFRPEKFKGQFIPGKIYIFRYNPKQKQDDSKKKEREFINRLPIVLAFDVKKSKDLNNILYGSDLIATPPDERVKILERIYDFSENIIESNKKSGNQAPVNLSGDKVKAILNGTGYIGSTKGFDISSMSEVYVIDYEDWKKIPYLSVALLQGSSPTEIYNSYRSKLKDNSGLESKNK
jgi:hypothetical protein